jgi:hypothetical protein
MHDAGHNHVALTVARHPPLGDAALFIRSVSSAQPETLALKLIMKVIIPLDPHRTK